MTRSLAYIGVLVLVVGVCVLLASPSFALEELTADAMETVKGKGCAGICDVLALKACPEGEAANCDPDPQEEWCWVVTVLDIWYVKPDFMGWWICTEDMGEPKACCTYGEKWEYDEGCECSPPPDYLGYGGCTYPKGIFCPGDPTCPIS